MVIYAVDKGLRRSIKVEAAKRDLTMGEFVQVAVEDYLAHEALSMKGGVSIPAIEIKED